MEMQAPDTPEASPEEGNEDDFMKIMLSEEGGGMAHGADREAAAEAQKKAFETRQKAAKAAKAEKKVAELQRRAKAKAEQEAVQKAAELQQKAKAKAEQDARAMAGIQAAMDAGKLDKLTGMPIAETRTLNTVQKASVSQRRAKAKAKAEQEAAVEKLDPLTRMPIAETHTLNYRWRW